MLDRIAVTTAAILLLTALPAGATERSASVFPAAVPWNVGEKLSFKIKVGIIPAGRATMEVRDIQEIRPSTANPAFTASVYHIVATAKSNKFVDVFYKVRDRNESWLDREKLITHRFEQHNHEGKYVLDQIITYDWIGKWFRSVKNVKGRDPRINDGSLTVPAVDTLSVLYLTRTKDLEAGAEFTMDVHTRKAWPLVLKVIKRETVKVEAGKFDCYLVEPFMREKGIFVQKGKRIRVWLTADERRMPVLMKAEIFIGHVSAELVEYSP